MNLCGVGEIVRCRLWPGERLALDLGQLFDAEEEARGPLIDTVAGIAISADVVTDEFGNPIVDALKELLIVTKLIVLAPSLEDAIELASRW